MCCDDLMLLPLLYRAHAAASSQVEACGYTIAPLQARYQAAGLSSECLVTMVLKLNPGGWLGPFRRLGLLSERSVLNNFVEPLLLSVTTLRDKVRAPYPVPVVSIQRSWGCVLAQLQLWA